MYLKRLLSTNIKHTINFFRYQSTAYLSKNKEDLIINSKDQSDNFPLVWLRDNCRCKYCFHSDSNSRIINWCDFDTSPKVNSIEVVDNDIILKWQDDHVSKFERRWLQKHSFRKDIQENYLEQNYRPNKILWNKNRITHLIQKFDFKDVMNNNAILCNWLMNLAQHGVAFINNVPKDKSVVKNLANRIAFIRKTHYQDVFDVTSTPGTTNVAYLSGSLQLHTDLPYYEYIPGVTLLHCLVQTDSTGGESLLSDGFYVAEKLREEDRHNFKILSSVEVNWCDIGAEHGENYHSIFRSPVIRLDLQGKVDKIFHSVPQRDSHFTVDMDLIKPWYKAMKVFVDAINTEAYKFKLAPGSVMAFDNTRLLHGRLGYKDVGYNQRHLMGCYIDWDEIYSKIRVLMQEQN